MDDWKKTSIYLAVVTIIGASVDVMLSYVAYLEDPIFFIHNEANFEAVLFFHYGQFPILYVMFHTSYIFFFTMFFKHYYNRRPQIAVTIGVLITLSAIGHIFGGLTWFDTGRMMHILLEGLKIVVNGIIIFAIVFYVILCYKTWKLNGGKMTRCWKCGRITIFTDCECERCKDEKIRKMKEEEASLTKKETQQPEGSNL